MKNLFLHRSIRIGTLCLLPGLLLTLGILAHPLHANEQTRWFAATGHTVDDTYGFLSYWRDHDGEYLLGLPVTEVLHEEAGIPVQYFERGRLEYHPKLHDGTILRGRIGADYAEALWRTFEPADPDSSIDDATERLFVATGYTLSAPFLAFWEDHDGLTTFGYPISAPLWEYIGHQVLRVQYFERGRLEYDPSASTPSADADVRISNLGRDLALLRGYDTATIPAPAEPVLLVNTPTPLPTPVPTAIPAPPPTAPAALPVPAQQPVDPMAQPMVVAPAPVSGGGRKSIVVNISQQWLYAYEGSTIVFDAPVTTGRDGFNTPAGTFAIYAKVPSQTMSGNLGGESYRVPNVPHAMYIYGDVAMHGTYWHNAFGSGVRLSHGCINLPLWAAAWVYNWAPVGTPVQVRY